MCLNDYINKKLGGVALLTGFLFTILISCSSGNNENNQEDMTDSTAVTEEPGSSVEFIEKASENKIDVMFDGELFTSYFYPEGLAKPVLFPIVTKAGNIVTRYFPYMNKEGERVDHLHHVGHWFNYGDVNGLDFWNNSSERSAEEKHKYGSIVHKAVTSMSVEGNVGTLSVETDWVDHEGIVLLTEKTTFSFYNEGDDRYFDRVSTLTAQGQDVSFTDNKEGMFAIRVTRAMELPTDKPAVFTDAQGNETEVKQLNNEGVSGDYLSSEGGTGAGVWGTRGKWMLLHGEIEGNPTGIAIFDHPDNPGYPTYWHARDYGLFAANPLGQKVFTEGAEELNYALKTGESVTFKYRMLIHSGSEQTVDELEAVFQDFTK